MSSSDGTTSEGRGAALVTIAGGTLAVVGSFLPWVSLQAPFVGTIQKSGMEGGDGVITLVIGAIALLVGIAYLTSAQLPRVVTGSPILGALGVGFVAILNYMDVSSRVGQLSTDTEGLGSGSVGVGLYSLGFAALLLLVGGVSGAGSGQIETTAPKKATRQCPFCRMNIDPEASVCPHCQRASSPWRMHEGRWWKEEGGRKSWQDNLGQWQE